MIYNERQFKITKHALNKILSTLQTFSLEDALKETNGDRLLAQAMVDSLVSERDVLSEQLHEYESLKNGTIKILEAQTLNELPSILVRARIAKGQSQKQLAELVGIKEQQIQRYEAENYASASLRRLIEIADALGLQISEKARLEVYPLKTVVVKSDTLDFSKFPIKEMYRRGWFHGFSGSLQDAHDQAKTLLDKFFEICGSSQELAYHRKHVRGQSSLNGYALFAWQCRVTELALSQTFSVRYTKTVLSKRWIDGLAKLSSNNDGPKLAVNYLRDAGISLVIEPHLPQTFLDGAVFIAPNKRPVIGLTLRYDRLDNFWFVLFHELAHLSLHFETNEVEACFDDLEAKPDEIEKQADDFAGEALIPQKVWENSPARYLRTGDTVTALANELTISPALVAGRIRKEADNYIILKEFIGSGEVRNKFPEINFGV